MNWLAARLEETLDTSRTSIKPRWGFLFQLIRHCLNNKLIQSNSVLVVSSVRNLADGERGVHHIKSIVQQFLLPVEGDAAVFLQRHR